MHLISRALLLLLLLLLPSAGMGICGEPAALSRLTAPALPADDLFLQEHIPRVRLELSPEAMEKLRTKPKSYVAGDVREGATLYTNVSIRLKGGPGSFRPLDDRPGFTLNFGRLVSGQTFHGLKKLHLNNSVQDSSYLSEKICREMFEAAGVPAPRAAHAIVDLNDRPLGMHVLVEGIDKQFLKRYFKDAKGNLYDGHSQQDVTQRLRTNSGESPQDQRGLAALAAAAREPDLTRRKAALEKTLDLERFLSFVATEVIVCHWDGYSLNRNNFRIYHDRASDRMVFLPHGLDQTFQRPNIPAVPPMAGLVAKSVLEVPEFAERFRVREAQLLTNVFQVEPLVKHLREVAAKVRGALTETDAAASESYLPRAAAFRRRIQQRLHKLTPEAVPPVGG